MWAPGGSHFAQGVLNRQLPWFVLKELAIMGRDLEEDQVEDEWTGLKEEGNSSH